MQSTRLGLVDPPILEFRAGQRSVDPIYAFAINGYKPYRMPNIAGPIKIHILYQNRNSSAGLERIVTEMIEGNVKGRYRRSKFPPFSYTFGINMSLVETVPYKDIVDVQKVINELSCQIDRASHVLIVLSQERSNLGGFYFEVKIASIQKGVQTQIVLENTVDNYVSRLSDDERGDFLWNMSLGIFAKIGGIPWKLYQPLKGVSAFIALNSIVSKDVKRGTTTRQGVVALEVANNWGEPCGRFLAYDVSLGYERERFDLDPDSLKKLILLTLAEVEKYLINPEHSKQNEYIIIHTRDNYSFEVYNTIKEAILMGGFQKFKIIHVAEHGNLVLFDSSAKINQQWPDEGSYWFMKEGHIAYLYTMGKWRYTPLGIPYVITSGGVTPIQVKLVKSSNNTGLSISDLSDIYSLTRLHYYSGDIPRIKAPSTLRLGQKAAQLASSGLRNRDYDISYLY